MKQLRPFALGLVVSAWCAAIAFAGGPACANGKSAAAAASSKSCCGMASATTATTAAQAGDHCGMGASATTAANDHCAKGAAATTAANDHCAKGATATAASNCGMDPAQCTPEMREACMKQAKAAKSGKGTKAAMSCPMGSAQCTAEMREACAKGTMATAGADHCAKGTMAKGAANGCPMHGAGVVSDMGLCGAAGASHSDCAVCSDEIECQEALRGASVRAQVVALRNGAMLVYTADTPEGVRALQATVARHHEHVIAALAANSEASLCGGCKEFRGAMASGKFSRELVNVKNGCQVLLTSSDREMVRRIHGMTGAQTAMRVKT